MTQSIEKSKPWIRLYRESLHDPKIVTLSDRQHRAWHNLLLIADDAGTLPSLRDIAVHMRVTMQDAEQLIADLIEAELVDVDMLDGARTFSMHGWHKRQFTSDSSTERSRKFRAKQKETPTQQECNVAATAPDTESDTDTDSENTQGRAREVSSNADDLHRQAFKAGKALKGDRVAKSARAVQRGTGELDGSRDIAMRSGALIVSGEARRIIAEAFPGIDVDAVADRACPELRKFSYPSYDDAMAVLRKWARIVASDRAVKSNADVVPFKLSPTTVRYAKPVLDEPEVAHA